ncbi:Erythritol/L-threitol dehydrogenase [bioreactor metagenome]|uniref:Erythritol/L-threitol dehydrogenase n=1 Tax=bioreactor metagenome TaxID=1076179 RepID=A0A644XLR0_9ZZZZ
MEKMRAVVQHAAFDFRVELVDKPVPGPLEAVIQIEASGICAGDRIMYEGKAPWGIHDGEIPGHEYVGVITQTGEGFTEKYGLDLGDRCLAEVQIPCGECYCCRGGFYNLCDNPNGFLGGGWAEYMLLRCGAIIHRVPKNIDKLCAATIEPLSCGAYAVERAGVGMADTVVVAGMGIIGLAALQFAKLHTPYRLIALSATDASLAIARSFGVDAAINVLTENAPERIRELTGGVGCDVFIECSGVASSVSIGLDALKKRGRLAVYGVYTRNGDLNLNEISQNKELTLIGGHLSPNTMPYVIRCLEQGLVDPRPMITEVFKLDQFDEAINIRRKNPDSIKTLLVP